MSGTLAEKIKEQAKELGFDLVGVAAAVPSEHGDFFAEWLEKGYAGEMEYMARNIERRISILETMPEAHSVVVVGWNYYQPAEEPEGDGSRGRFARYARGKDYHKVMESRLKELLAFVRQESGHEVKAKIYVDAGPVLEREVGSLSGIGWFGKNTMLIYPHLGSWFLLGELILDIELDYGPPFRFDHCGTCNRCLEACPTGAIRAPRLVDSTLCISYLTIELRGPIPHDLRPQMGNWVFGCDICQEVCPWNKKFARPTQDESFHSNELASVDLAAMADLSEEEFQMRFGDMPIKRARRQGFLRNVAVALGNWGSEEAVPALKKLLADREAQVRGHAAWALGKFDSGKARRALEGALDMEAQSDVVAEIRQALGGMSEIPISGARRGSAN